MYKTNKKKILKESYETKLEQNKWKDIPCFGVENSPQLNIIQMSVLPKLSYKFNIIQIKSQYKQAFLRRQLLLKFNRKNKHVRIANKKIKNLRS